MSDTFRSLVDRPEWMELAECRGMDTRLFFPERGEATAAAKETCRRCDVQAECLAYAFNAGEHHGIWGGVSERGRRRLRPEINAAAERARIDAARCGTKSGAESHRRRGEPPCEQCRIARNEYMRNYQRHRRANAAS